MLVAAEDEINLAQDGGNSSVSIFPSRLLTRLHRRREVSARVQ